MKRRHQFHLVRAFIPAVYALHPRTLAMRFVVQIASLRFIKAIGATALFQKAIDWIGEPYVARAFHYNDIIGRIEGPTIRRLVSDHLESWTRFQGCPSHFVFWQSTPRYPSFSLLTNIDERWIVVIGGHAIPSWLGKFGLIFRVDPARFGRPFYMKLWSFNIFVVADFPNLVIDGRCKIKGLIVREPQWTLAPCHCFGVIGEYI
mmetsp:Transcript_12554/g.26736  ORF Transcript_12554/g.26736 Transcript_12554/m.26736 type:complete len:204 (-) Transcript_12554:124-735(-)